jgi:hypothetical protein
VNNLEDVVRRAGLEAERFAPPDDGFEGMIRYRDRRQRNARLSAGIVALSIVIAGAIGAAALFRSTAGPAATIRPADHEPSGRTAPHPPPGPVLQQIVGGKPTQQLGGVTLGLSADGDCLHVRPSPVGQSWTFADENHACAPALAGDTFNVSIERATIRRDGASGPATRFTAVFGRVRAGVRTLEVRWADGQTSIVAAAGGQFLLAWTGTAVPDSVTALAADGATLATHVPR